MITLQELELKRDGLVERLNKGEARIENARKGGEDVTEWEDYWIDLLRQYEITCNRIKELQRTSTI